LKKQLKDQRNKGDTLRSQIASTEEENLELQFQLDGLGKDVEKKKQLTHTKQDFESISSKNKALKE